MTDNQRLRQREAEFDDALHAMIDSILFRPWLPADGHRILGLSHALNWRLGEAAQAFRDELLNAAHTAPQEVAEGYRSRAEGLGKEANSVIFALLEHRKRRERGQGDTAA